MGNIRFQRGDAGLLLLSGQLEEIPCMAEFHVGHFQFVLERYGN